MALFKFFTPTKLYRIILLKFDIFSVKKDATKVTTVLFVEDLEWIIQIKVNQIVYFIL